MIKPGVDLAGIQPEMAIAYSIVQPIFAKYGTSAVITSVRDGDHGHASLHNVGYAIDLRTRDILPSSRQTLKDDVASALGPQYDVVLEKTHLHIEFQPK